MEKPDLKRLFDSAIIKLGTNTEISKKLKKLGASKEFMSAFTDLVKTAIEGYILETGKNHSPEGVMKKTVSAVNRELSEIKNETLGIFLQDVKPVPLKTMEEQVVAAKKEVELLMAVYREDMKRAVECLLTFGIAEEYESLGRFFGKMIRHTQVLARKNEGMLLDDADLVLLDKIATRTFSNNHLEEAGCLWRLLIQLNPLSGRAWVGWAISEQAAGRREIAETVYKTALALLPYDAYIAAFAADFYLIENRSSLATETLKNAIHNMAEIGESDSFKCTELKHQLANL